MKKILSFLLSITLLATLVPTVFVGAAPSQAIVYITEDTTLTARNINNSGYGVYVGGNDNLLLWSKRDSANVGYLLHKIPLSGITVPAGKKIAKVEFSFSPTYDPAKASSYSYAGQYDNAPVCFYVADSDWDESTTNMFAWCTDKNAVTPKTPELTWANSKYGAIAAQADLTCTVSMAAMSASKLSQKLTFDITSLYEKAIASNMLDANGNFSVLTRVGQDNTGGWTTYVASAEHTNESLRPHIIVTFEDIPSLNVVSETVPENPSDNFSLTFSNEIVSAVVSVNGNQVSNQIDGFGLTVDYSFEPFSVYDVEVNVTDIYGQKINKSYYFATVADFGNTSVLAVSGKDISLEGALLSKADFSLNTTLNPDFAKYVWLVDSAGNKVVDSAGNVVENADNEVGAELFACSDASITLTQPVTLLPDNEYSIIIKAHADTLDSDLTVQSLYTGDAFDYDSDGYYKLYTTNNIEPPTVEYIYINPDFGGMQYSIVIADKETGDEVYSKYLNSTLGGKVGELVALSSGNYDIKIAPMGAQIGWIESFRLFGNDALDTYWNIMTSSDASAIEADWEAISEAFSVTKSAETDTTALCKVLGYNAIDFGNRDSANINKFKTHLAACELLAQLNQCVLASAGEAKAMLEATFPQVEAADSAAYALISADWSELGTKITKEYQKTADEVFTASAEAAKLLVCIDTVKRADILDNLNALGHTSLIYDFVTNDVNAHYLGITDLVDDYKSLGSTSSVDSAVQGKGFATAGAFRSAFSAAIDLAKLETPPTPPVQKPSYSSGGGGGGSFGVISATPSAIPETGVPETGVALPFADVANHTWAHSAIATLHSKGIIAGRGDGSFAPDDKVTRAEFAKMLVLALGIESKTTDIAFADVASTDWFASYARTAAANGIVLGSNGLFMPGESITRQDAAVMISRAASLAGGTMPAFTDSDSISSYARDAVASLCASGIIKGMEDGSFAPVSSLTRAQAAVMLSRIMEV